MIGLVKRTLRRLFVSKKIHNKYCLLVLFLTIFCFNFSSFRYFAFERRIAAKTSNGKKKPKSEKQQQQKNR